MLKDLVGRLLRRLRALSLLPVLKTVHDCFVSLLVHVEFDHGLKARLAIGHRVQQLLVVVVRQGVADSVLLLMVFKNEEEDEPALNRILPNIKVLLVVN